MFPPKWVIALFITGNSILSGCTAIGVVCMIVIIYITITGNVELGKLTPFYIIFGIGALFTLAIEFLSLWFNRKWKLKQDSGKK